jgi:hypothetical protein
MYSLRYNIGEQVEAVPTFIFVENIEERPLSYIQNHDGASINA